MKLPATPVHDTSGSAAFSVSASVFDAHWNASDALPNWVEQRAASRRAVTFKERLLSTKRILDNALRRIREVWCA